MAIKNFTTQIKASKTVAEIQELLIGAGASSFYIKYRNSEISAVVFSITVYDQKHNFRLPVNPEGVLASMQRDGVQNSYCNIEQARRTAWRIIKDWIHSQIALIDSGQTTLAEVFFPHLVLDTNETVFKAFANQKYKMLDK